MKKIILSLFLFLLGSFGLYAQNGYAIKGFVVDTAYTARLVNSSVSVWNAKDSTLVKYSRVGSNGSFSVPALRPGNFILLVTYPGYADYWEKFSLDSVKKEKDFGKVNLLLKANLLSAVEIKGAVNAVKMNGDTTEFNADSYIIQPNSKVEALLKQLPGVQVSKDGKITAQGKAVDKVLVDGEEFFGDDPTLVTKNIRGDMVDKVQLYDRKSEQASFTGIDDGQRAKTINLKLKEGKKNGAFGKVNAGLATDKMYEGQATYNRFRGKRKFGLYGNMANTGNQMGMSSFDMSSLDDMDFSGGGGGMVTMVGGMGEDLDTFDGGYGGQGIPLSRAGGLHYDNKWNSGKESVNGNYKVNNMNVEGTRNVQTQNNYADRITKSNSDEAYTNSSFGQKLDGKYAIKLDSMTNLKVSFGASLKHSETQNIFSESTFREDDTKLNASDRNLDNKTNGKAFRTSVLWTRKFQKKGRTLSFNVSENITQNHANGFLKSQNRFYDKKGVLLPDSTENTDQYKTNKSNSAVFNSNLAYSEPITASFAAQVNYGLNVNNSSQDRRSYNASTPGEYTVLDSLFSNNYKLDQLTNTAGLMFNYRKEKSVLNFGTRLVAVKFEQKNVFTDESIKRNFVNWSPQLNYQYMMSPQKSLRFSYGGQTSQPGIDQIQPVRVNTDPLNITIGNPNLKPSFNNNFSIGYNSFKLLSSQALMVNGSYSFTMNPIMVNTVRDETTGKSIYQAVNLTEKNNTNYGLNIGFGSAVKALDMNANVNLSANGSTNYSFLNSELNQTKSYGFSANLNLMKAKESKYNFNLDFSPNYNISQSSLQKQFNDNGWGFSSRPSMTLYLPGKIELSSDGEYEFRAKTKSFDENFSRFIWNASISRKFLKDQSLYLTISAKDILNQNNGFNRSASENSIVQTNYTMIRRYVICSLSWDFNKMGGA
ncbi:outer membrane beta-barrel family protein [Pedobacter nutrimenti]|uniref:outer membrane beta-barrel family protein n=1 Tax=Pedobacter nutrimenti TaxID=1241337 RepID=UPI00292D7B1C|nr:outer membrane beta-barrel family protein [Pedobacter nutrimenti]